MDTNFHEYTQRLCRIYGELCRNIPTSKSIQLILEEPHFSWWPLPLQLAMGLTCGHLWSCWWTNEEEKKKLVLHYSSITSAKKSTKQWARVKFRWCQLKTSGCHLANQDRCAPYMLTIRPHKSIIKALDSMWIRLFKEAYQDLVHWWCSF